MVNKELFKTYMLRKCKREVWLNYNEKVEVKILNEIKELKIKDVELDLVDDGENQYDQKFDSLYELIRLYPDKYKEFLIKEESQLDVITKFILEMKSHNEISNLSREWFIQHFKGIAKRADTRDGSLDGEVIYSQSLIERNTLKYLSDPEIKIIFEGQFSYNGLQARWDALVREQDGFHLYEVKGSSSIYKNKSKNLKDDYLQDIFFQYLVYINNGLKINQVSFLHLNNEYENPTEDVCFYPMDINLLPELFTECHECFKDKTRYTIKDFLDHHCGDLQIEVNKLLEIVRNQDEPTQILTYECKKCTFLDSCFTLDEDHIFNLTNYAPAGGHYTRVQNLIKNDVISIKDIDSPILDEYQFISKDQSKNLIARMQIEYAKGNLKDLNQIDFTRMKCLLNEYNYPLVFFDFESMSYPIPLVIHAKPWEQVCSQYSMHIVREGFEIAKHDYNSKEESGGIKHAEFIGNPQKDRFESPDYPLIQKLYQDFEDANIDWKNNNFTLVVYNKSYENSRLGRIKEKYPQYEPFINSLQENIKDLREFFINGYWYRRDFGGKTGLKTVIKSLSHDPNIQKRYVEVKDFSENLDYSLGKIKNGGIALDAYQSLLRKVLMSKSKDTNKINDQILESLRYYCKIDTWSNVVIFDIIKRIIEEHDSGTFVNW